MNVAQKTKHSSEDHQQFFSRGSKYKRNTSLSTPLNSIMKNCNGRKTLKKEKPEKLIIRKH